jgi:hypothetical protein
MSTPAFYASLSACPNNPAQDKSGTQRDLDPLRDARVWS